MFGSSSVAFPAKGATHKVSPWADMAAGLPGTRLPTWTVRSTMSKSGSIRLTATQVPEGFEVATHTALSSRRSRLEVG